MSYQQKDGIDGQFFRNMGTDQMLALLSLAGYAVDDILAVHPIYYAKVAKPYRAKTALKGGRRRFFRCTYATLLPYISTLALKLIEKVNI